MIGNNDQLFECKYGAESYNRLKEMCDSVGTEWVELIVLEGSHEFCKFDYPIENLISDIKQGIK